jgi:mannose-6-phosphate isomerase-like protein (cupin superfamily)
VIDWEERLRHIVKIDPVTFPAGVYTRVLAGAETGIDSCVLSCSRLPAGASGLDLHTHSVDQFYYAVAGIMKMQLGTETFDVGPGTLVFIPAGTPHTHWNDGTQDALHFEFLIPAPQGELATFAEPRAVADAASLIRRAQDDGPGVITPSSGFNVRNLADRVSGSKNVSIAQVDLQPALGGARLHFHDFDQFYFVLEGTLDLQIGTKKMAAGPNSLVVLPAGTLHANFNAGPAAERHVTLRVPEPQKGEPLERLVAILPDGHLA